MSEDISQMFERIQQLQEQMALVQQELGTKTVTMESGGGVVKVTANGKLEISSIEIDKDVIDPNEKEMLEDLIIAAVNRSIERARELADSSMNEVARSMLPPGFPIS